jgi:hypothetical protein
MNLAGVTVSYKKEMQELFKYTWGQNIWKAAKKGVGEKDNLQNAYVHLFFCIIILFHATVFLKNRKYYYYNFAYLG